MAQAARRKAREGVSGLEMVSCTALDCCFLSCGQGIGGSNATVIACVCGMQTVWMTSSVSSDGVMDRCRVLDDVSSSFGSEGVFTSPISIEGTRTALITSVCGVVVLVFAVSVLVI